MNDPDKNLKEAIMLYEECCNSGRAQSDDAWAAKKRIESALDYRGLEWNTVNLARYGMKRAIGYIERGLVDGYEIVDGKPVQKRAKQWIKKS